jgi:hypothetical protein
MKKLICLLYLMKVFPFIFSRFSVSLLFFYILCFLTDDIPHDDESSLPSLNSEDDQFFTDDEDDLPMFDDFGDPIEDPEDFDDFPLPEEPPEDDGHHHPHHSTHSGGATKDLLTTHSKYLKMLKVGLPKEMIIAKMKQDHVNPAILDLLMAEMNNSDSSETAKTTGSTAISSCLPLPPRPPPVGPSSKPGTKLLLILFNIWVT